MSNYPTPPDFLRQQAIGPPLTLERFLHSGYVASLTIRRTLKLVGRRFRDFRHVLDFGCGGGRVLRWFDDLQNACTFHGVDISQEAINWCKRNIPFAKFTKNDPLPPLPFPGETFDLVYGISVFTHLDEEYQDLWLRELQRVTKPEAIVVLTTHGDRKAYMDLTDEEYLRFRSHGFIYKRIVEQGGVDGLPDFYQVAYHTKDYVERNWSQFFEICSYIRHGPLWHQDLVLMKKVPRRSREDRPSYTLLDLPIFFLETPRPGELVFGDEIEVSGWAFYPEGGQVSIDLRVDEKEFGSCVAEIRRRDVAQDYPKYQSAELSGFATKLSTETLSEGYHVLELLARTNIVPSMVTYFKKGSLTDWQFIPRN